MSEAVEAFAQSLTQRIVSALRSAHAPGSEATLKQCRSIKGQLTVTESAEQSRVKSASAWAVAASTGLAASGRPLPSRIGLD
jgi:hypothetical protein